MLKGKLSREVVSERQQYVNSLKRFVLEQKEKYQHVLKQLKLSEDSLSKVEAKQICPFDRNHSVPESAFKAHIEKCRLLKAGYQTDELPSQLQNVDICYEGSQVMKVTFDESLLNKIIWDECAQSGQVYTGHRTMPISHIDEAVNLTEGDRLAVYNHVVKVSHEAGKFIPVDQSDQLLTTDWGQLVKKGMLNEQSNKQYSSKLEQLAALRDMKRRRQSYRAKNVHITKKSYTEIIREVIVNQMEILEPNRKDSSRSDPEEKNSNRDRKRTRRERDDSRERDRSRHGQSPERARERRGREEKREKRARHHDSPEGKEPFSDTVKSTKYESSEDFKLVDIKIEPEELDGKNSGGKYSFEQSEREKSTKRRRKDSESSLNSNDSSGDNRHHKSKHKKSKHKKKHSKKHKRRD